MFDIEIFFYSINCYGKVNYYASFSGLWINFAIH